MQVVVGSTLIDFSPSSNYSWSTFACFACFAWHSRCSLVLFWFFKRQILEIINANAFTRQQSSDKRSIAPQQYYIKIWALNIKKMLKCLYKCPQIGNETKKNDCLNVQRSSPILFLRITSYMRSRYPPPPHPLMWPLPCFLFFISVFSFLSSNLFFHFSAGKDLDVNQFLLYCLN